ncbi:MULTISPECIES: hypothetical protein [Yersinia pseudotuberculosis complex]|uniref:Uncharacterized protein n=4 Tax=Yersinia pseudotuberculosis complex TaxID=1649845 RepID=Q8CKU9_YERPE|nr:MULTISPECIES: hypothetical protein [Yersinia pseudotuberculosis complex]ABS48737.1 hypothetical protein YpsIP31758_2629 [Yersinia pseudotuberculosis IP 31758]EDR31697.1 hypothetical protein YPIP275_3844 [Yersinia pestis biovar Orientalis str. IP275]EFA46284.1 conserved hypothetical protein [Yersinia pestis KIM D27]EIQ92096.1 hypothetical protein YPPY02_1572 [Yersinia pestis PY-02]EIR67442.1 hypothetical protein YPPY25_1638 [Yersinia pestis PY-25]ERP75594.1 membrane protein [Yersinia pestis
MRQRRIINQKLRDDPVSLTPRPCDLPYLTVMLQAAYALAAFLPLELFGV